MRYWKRPPCVRWVRDLDDSVGLSLFGGLIVILRNWNGSTYFYCFRRLRSA
jgi:hypothetical protein